MSDGSFDTGMIWYEIVSEMFVIERNNVVVFFFLGKKKILLSEWKDGIQRKKGVQGYKIKGAIQFIVLLEAIFVTFVCRIKIIFLYCKNSILREIDFLSKQTLFKNYLKRFHVFFLFIKFWVFYNFRSKNHVKIKFLKMS